MENNKSLFENFFYNLKKNLIIGLSYSSISNFGCEAPTILKESLEKEKKEIKFYNFKEYLKKC